MFERIYRILASFLGDSRQGGYAEDCENYQFNCPCCRDENGGVPDNKYNLEILLSPTKGLKFHCWKCGDTDGMKGRVAYLIRRYGGMRLYAEYRDEMEALRNSTLYDISLFDEIFSEDGESAAVKLPDTFARIDMKSCPCHEVVEYLKERGITQNIVDMYSIGYTDGRESNHNLRNRIIIPSYDSAGVLNYWVGRDFTHDSGVRGANGFVRPKYRNCEADKKKIVFQESLIDWDSMIILVEGAIDCLYFTGNAVSMLGKRLTKDMFLYERLMKKANGPIYICLDSDTSMGETKRIYRLLDNGRLKGKIWYIRMNEYKDFGDAYEKGGKRAIISLIRSARQFTDSDMMLEE